MTAASSDINPIIRKLESIFRLGDDERDELVRLPIDLAQIRADQDIVREADRPSRCCALLEGFTCTYKMSEAGGRQIVSFGVPGDIPDAEERTTRLKARNREGKLMAERKPRASAKAVAPKD